MAKTRPTTARMLADRAPPVQATRRARSMSPAPIAMPTSGTQATPIAKVIGMSRNSSRAPMP